MINVGMSKHTKLNKEELWRLYRVGRELYPTLDELGEVYYALTDKLKFPVLDWDLPWPTKEYRRTMSVAIPPDLEEEICLMSSYAYYRMGSIVMFYVLVGMVKEEYMDGPSLTREALVQQFLALYNGGIGHRNIIVCQHTSECIQGVL